MALDSEAGPYMPPPRIGTPIHRLPSELLTRVFLNLRLIWEPTYFSQLTRGDAPWIVITQVCKLWRDTAHESATLWSRISGFYPSHIIEQWFKLSKSAPLRITNLSLSTDEVTPSFKDAISRVRCLGVRVQVDNRKKQSPLLLGTAPILESLALSFTASRDSQTLESLFSGIPPPFRHLSIEGCGLGSNSAFLTHLTILEICEPEPRFSAPDFLSVLHKLAFLTTLRMSNVLQCSQNPQEERTFTQIPINIGVVELPSLDLLSIHGSSYAQDLDFLSHLSLSSTIKLLFSSGFPYRYSHPFASISDFLNVHASARQNFANFAPTRVDLSPLYGRTKLDIWEGDTILCAFKLDFKPGPGESQFRVVNKPEIRTMLSSLSFPSVTTFSTNCYVRPSVWPIISSSFPSLEDISHKDKDDATTILEVIIGDYKSTSSNPTSWIPIFPRLRSLSIERAVFKEDCAKDLVQALEGRKQVSAGLENLEICISDGLDEVSLDSLRGVEGLCADCQCVVVEEEDPKEYRLYESSDSSDSDEYDWECSVADSGEIRLWRCGLDKNEYFISHHLLERDPEGLFDDLW
ncbi:hypothetical protein BDN72DRAFT_842424 [Pluteus cervinus]|uniref:Uncharacterized protein n=1 Tax=Pluteus cervinus TaxID=181527 RepID=A0ACD3AQC4_9AGAR|nr:hypothetical protein BDN72DRAFT_842424 [Pluteus cervinus]